MGIGLRAVQSQKVSQGLVQQAAILQMSSPELTSYKVAAIQLDTKNNKLDNAYGLSNNIVAYYITPVTQSLGYTRAAFNFCFTLMSIVSFLATPVYGWMFMKVPIRKIIVIGGAAGAAFFWYTG